jgi:hypothetical protein
MMPPMGTYCEAGHAVQSEPEPEPSVGIYLPEGQLMQAPAPEGAKVDWGHISHGLNAEPVAVEYLPARQGVQTPDPIDSAYRPASQGEQAPDAAVAYFPASHALQSVKLVLRDLAVAVPAGQGEHSVTPFE